MRAPRKRLGPPSGPRQVNIAETRDRILKAATSTGLTTYFNTAARNVVHHRARTAADVADVDRSSVPRPCHDNYEPARNLSTPARADG